MSKYYYDAVGSGHKGMLKNVSALKLTNQLKETGMSLGDFEFLFIKIPKSCQISQRLQAFSDSILTPDGQKKIRFQRY